MAYLVAERLAAASGHQNKDIAASNSIFYHFLLTRSKGAVPKLVSTFRQRIFHVSRTVRRRSAAAIIIIVSIVPVSFQAIRPLEKLAVLVVVLYGALVELTSIVGFGSSRERNTGKVVTWTAQQRSIATVATAVHCCRRKGGAAANAAAARIVVVVARGIRRGV